MKAKKFQQRMKLRESRATDDTFMLRRPRNHGGDVHALIDEQIKDGNKGFRFFLSGC